MRSLVPFTVILLGGCAHLGAEPIKISCGELLAANSETYQYNPLFADLQRDAGSDECPTGADRKPYCGSQTALAPNQSMVAADDRILQALGAWAADGNKAPGRALDKRAEIPVLLLSGGGAWGAFGAGYLNALPRREWAVVTGISTGALQALYVAAGDYAALASAYAIKSEDKLVTPNGLGILWKGSEYSIAPLHREILNYLLPAVGESPLLRMRQPGRPALSIAMVEARTGDLKVVHVTRLLDDALGGEPQPRPADLERAARCVAGVALASSSIPVRLSPVQIDGHTFLDGGVRSSVFVSGIARRIKQFARVSKGSPHLFVIRNGPTIVFRDSMDRDNPEIAEVDKRPDLQRVGMRAYSTIVNQNELMSIASLRLIVPEGPISVIAADGFNAPFNPRPCGPRPKSLFDPKFMRCLVAWGEHKARSGPPWIEIKNISDIRAKP